MAVQPLKAVFEWVLRTMMKDQTGIVRTMPKKDLVDFNVAMTAERLMRNGFDPNAFKNANQVENAINQIEAPRNVQQGIKSTDSAKVFDMEGKEIPKGSKIMGGKQAETEAEIAARISKENKESVARIKNQKMIDDAIDNASPGFSGDTKYDAELVAEDLAERMGLVYDDLPTKQRLDLYDQAYTGLSKQRFKNRPASEDRAIEDFVDDAGGVNPDDPRGIDDFIPDPEDMAQGGRAGFKIGGIDKARRAFLKTMGVAGAGITALKTGLLGFGKGAAGKKAVEQVVTTPSVPGKPEWFDALVNKVILEGDDVTKQFATKEREIVHTKKLEEGKFADEVTVYRDLDDGTIRVEYSSVDNMSEAPVNLTFKPGMADETTKGKPADTFQADEIVPESRMVGPDDFEIEDAVDEFDNVTDLNSDVSKLKQFAGQKLTTKEIVEGINKRKRSRAIVEDRGEAADFMTSRQGDYDPSPDDFASGGIARMLGE